MNCVNCGAELQENAKYCEACGSTVAQEESTVTEEISGAAEDKVLGGSLEKKLFYGLSWILALFFPTISIVLNIIVLITDKDKLTLEDKRNSVSIFVMQAFGIICGLVMIIPIIGWVIGCIALLVWAVFATIFCIIAAIKAFNKEEYKIPLVYPIASSFVK